MDPLETVAEAARDVLRLACIVCKRSLTSGRVFVGTCGDECSAYLEGLCGGVAAGEWRATLKRDIAEVERALLDLRSEHKGAGERAQQSEAMLAHYWAAVHGAMAESRRLDGARAEQRKLRGRIADCEAWLARARAVLGVSS